MRYEFNRTGADRKALVTAISEILGRKASYLKMPTMAYDFGGLIIDKNGVAEFDNSVFSKDVEDFLRQLADRGFISENMETDEDQEEAPENESLGLTIAIPLEQVKVGNLTNLLEAKGYLIKKALRIEDIRIELDEKKVSFPWFSELPNADEVKAYQNFIAAICQMSLEQKRINATEKVVDNEKYAFRCFLLRLGFIGDDYKTDRKILLKNLSGNSAFRDGGAK